MTDPWAPKLLYHVELEFLSPQRNGRESRAKNGYQGLLDLGNEQTSCVFQCDGEGEYLRQDAVLDGTMKPIIPQAVFDRIKIGKLYKIVEGPKVVGSVRILSVKLNKLST
jgi:hypothetical protein